MSENLLNLETAVTARLAKERNLTPELIRAIIQRHLVIDDYYVDVATAEQLARTLETRLSVTMTIGSVLTERGYEPWLGSARADINPYYWNRYRELLVEKHYSPQVISSLDEVTDRILGLLENPAKEGMWDRRGMVVGHVQSGKTSNYIGVISKAADAGYKVIIVIAGIHNNLRNQTQLRIDEGFVGRNSSRLLSKKGDEFIGVGRFDQRQRPITFTNSVADFNKNQATGLGIPLQTLRDPAVFVIKKNATTLKNLIEWLREHSARGGREKVELPMLLIDDEADNASINVSQGKDAASRINSQIRNLLQMFDRSCYVGYTATPFANIFIDPDTDDQMLGEDLFPRHFIVSLDPPSNYFGASRVFLEEPNRIIRHIEDNEDWLPLKHRISTSVTHLPQSLLDAIRTYVVARAIRIARGHKRQHSSMLVNVSRFTGIQKQVRNEIHQALDRVQSSIRVNSALSERDAMKNPEIAKMHTVWRAEYSEAGYDWSSIQAHLLDAVASIKVVEINSSSSGSLNYSDYPDGLNVIAVGGFSLSRGLTLEGLMVSYFLRNSMMYDTLMQMGRWFGYRPEYDDLCRIWMPEEAQGWYEHITESIEMLRDELRTMEAAGATPEEFGLKVRAHPDTLIVTARNKMRATETIAVQIGLGNSFIETAKLKRDASSLEANRLAAIRLVDRLAKLGFPLTASVAKDNNRGFLLSAVPVDPILEFIVEFQNHSESLHTASGPVTQYIIERSDDELREWDVLFVSLRDADSTAVPDQSLGVTINCQRRSEGNKSDAKTLLITNKQRVASRGIEQAGLDFEEIESAKLDYRNSPAGKAKLQQHPEKPISYPDHIYRTQRKRPLLLIHLLVIGGEEENLHGQKPVVAWSISFPKTATPEKRVEYVVGSVWLRENYGEDLDEDEMSGDDV